MPYEIRVETLTSLPLVVVRRLARPEELSKVVPECCGLVWNAVKARGITGAGRQLAIYRDGEINLEVGVELDAPLEGDGEAEGELVSSATPAGRVAWTTHLGPYGRLNEAHAAVVGRCAALGETLAGPNWEIYGHWEPEWNRDPSLIRTDVFYLLG